MLVLRIQSTIEVYIIQVSPDSRKETALHMLEREFSAAIRLICLIVDVVNFPFIPSRRDSAATILHTRYISFTFAMLRLMCARRTILVHVYNE